jgi:hypothetical protein
MVRLTLLVVTCWRYLCVCDVCVVEVVGMYRLGYASKLVVDNNRRQVAAVGHFQLVRANNLR